MRREARILLIVFYYLSSHGPSYRLEPSVACGVSTQSSNGHKDLAFIDQFLHFKHNGKYLYTVFNPSKISMGVGTIIIIILQTKELLLEEVKKLTQSHSQGLK